jgi:hypothetical protein
VNRRPAQRQLRPLFGGYALVAFALAWMAGIWLAGAGPLETVAPLANLLTVPLLAPLLVVGGALAISAALGLAPLTLALAWVVWPTLAWGNTAITWSARLPLAALHVTQAPAVLAPVYYAALVGAVLALRPWLRAAYATLKNSHASERQRVSLSGRGLAVALVVAALASAGGSAPALAQRAVGRLDILDVGQGGSAIPLRLPGGFTALIDGGPSGPALESSLSGRLPFWQRRLDLAVLTDARAGDARGLEDAAAHYQMGLAVDAGAPSRDGVPRLPRRRPARRQRDPPARRGDADRAGAAANALPAP